MLEKLFLQVMDMSATGSLVILVVLLARLLLKKAPKVISYALWSAVLFRLLCPFSIETPISIVPQTQSVSEEYGLTEESVSFAGAGIAAFRAVGDLLNGGSGVQHVPATTRDELGDVEYAAAEWGDAVVLYGQYVWVAGVCVFVLYSILSYGKLRKSLGAVICLRENIYFGGDIPSPFVMGIIKPKIYLPSSLAEQERGYIIAHEQHHIHRGDHIFKAAAFLALTLHWLNPLVWLAFALANRDMEMSCDEAVIRKFGPEIRADYSVSLLTLATGRQIIGGTPLAFGEGDTKGRIRNLARWKKPAFWFTAVSFAACTVLAVSLATDPVREEHDLSNRQNWYYSAVTEGISSDTMEAGDPGSAFSVIIRAGETEDAWDDLWRSHIEGRCREDFVVEEERLREIIKSYRHRLEIELALVGTAEGESDMVTCTREPVPNGLENASFVEVEGVIYNYDPDLLEKHHDADTLCHHEKS